MTPRGVQPDESMSAVLRAFGIAGSRLIETFEASTQNDNLLVRAPSGAQYALRRCRRNESAARLRWQARFEDYLASEGFPVATVQTTSTGDPVVELDDERWTLRSFAAGAHYDFARIPQAENAARLLARFHLGTRDFAAIGSDHALELRHRRFFSAPAAEFRALRARFRDAELRATLDEAESWLAGVRRTWPLARFDALPSGWTHSDYHGRNLLFEGNDVSALIDFDTVEEAPFVLDLIRAIVAFGREGHDSNDIRVDVGRRVMAAYETVRAVSAEERSAIVELAGVFELRRDHFYDWHPHERRDPVAAARRRLEGWRTRRQQAASLATVVARPA